MPIVTSLTFAEIQTFYIRVKDMDEEERKSTSFQELAGRMTQEECQMAKFTPEQMAEYRRGGADAVQNYGGVR